MKKHLSMTILLTAAMLGTAACSGGGTAAPAATAAAATTASEKSGSEAETPAGTGDTGKSEAAADNSASADSASSGDKAATESIMRDVAKAIQGSIADKSLQDLSIVVSYPCYIGIGDGVIVENQDQFTALDPDEVLPDALVDAVLAADVGSLTISEAGLVLGAEEGKPNIIIGIGEENTVGITGINP